MVTGGTEGIGEAVTARLREAGAMVLTTARSPDVETACMHGPTRRGHPIGDDFDGTYAPVE